MTRQPLTPLSQPRVCILGASLHTANRGVSALAAALATLVWRSRPDATVTCLIGNRHAKPGDVIVAGRPRRVHTVNYRLSPRAPLDQQLWFIVLLSAIYRVSRSRTARAWLEQRSRWIHTVASADYVGDIRGGDSFSDIYGVQSFVIDLLPLLSVIWIRGGIHLLPQTYGPFRSSFARAIARYTLLRADSIWCRDRASLDEVTHITQGRRTGMLCPDVAFALEAVRPPSPDIDAPLVFARNETLIGLNVSGLLYNGGFTRQNMFGLRLDYREFVRRLVEQLLGDARNRVLLVPHTFAAEGRVESDPDACRQLKNQLATSLHNRVHLVTTAYDQHQIKGVIGLCDVFIGSRMHACIAALSQAIPTIGVAYSGKFSGVFDTAGAADWVIDGRTTALEEALIRVRELFDKREAQRRLLGETIGETRRALYRTFERVLGADAPSGGSDACYSPVPVAPAVSAPYPVREPHTEL